MCSRMEKIKVRLWPWVPRYDLAYHSKISRYFPRRRSKPYAPATRRAAHLGFVIIQDALWADVVVDGSGWDGSYLFFFFIFLPRPLFIVLIHIPQITTTARANPANPLPRLLLRALPYTSPSSSPCFLLQMHAPHTVVSPIYPGRFEIPKADKRAKNGHCNGRLDLIVFLIHSSGPRLRVAVVAAVVIEISTGFES